MAYRQSETQRVRDQPVHTTERALAFVDALHARGATEVLIDHPDVDGSGQPYADTLLVRVPPTGAARWHAEELCEKEGPGDVPPGDFAMKSRLHEIWCGGIEGRGSWN